MKTQQLQVFYLPLLRAASSVSPLLATLTENTRGGDTPSRAPALSSNAAAFDFSPAIPPPPRLRPFPADQLNLHPAPQRMRHANQRPHRQIPRLILHRRNLWREDQSELPSPPILPEQPFHPPKLLRIRSHQCHLSRQRLPRYQEVVCS